MKHGNLALFVPHLGCAHRCSFCDQSAITGVQSPMPAPQQVKDLCAATDAGGRRLELAFFGGSFTAVPKSFTEPLLQAAQPFLGKQIAGIRISTRPDAVPQPTLEWLSRFGVTAVELGAQSMQDAVLAQNGRGHTAQQVREAAQRVRAAGFSLGLQMMPGLPGEGPDGAEQTARAIIECRPDTVRIYPALTLRGTQMARQYEAGEYRPLSLDEAVQRTARVMELFEAANIRIIRVGLHPSLSLEQRLLAGPYHPAFRELCEGALMRERLAAQLLAYPQSQTQLRPVTVAVRPADFSRMVGQKRANLAFFRAQGYLVRIVAQPSRPPLQPLLLTGDAAADNTTQREGTHLCG